MSDEAAGMSCVQQQKFFELDHIKSKQRLELLHFLLRWARLHYRHTGVVQAQQWWH